MNDKNLNSNVKTTWKCLYCGTESDENAKICLGCKAPLNEKNALKQEKKIIVKTPEEAKTAGAASINLMGNTQSTPGIKFVTPEDFDVMYSLTEDKMIEEIIKREMVKASIDPKAKLIPSDILKKKKIFNAIFAVLLFAFITMIFFHFPIFTYIIGFVILFIFYKLTSKYNLIKYLTKELKSRPNEKISNIVMNVKSTFVKDNAKVLFIPMFIMVIVIPLGIFWNPRILYEKVDNGYAVRYYLFGVTNYKRVEIPSTYNNESVISLRGNTFSNMLFLEEVVLPDTIVEIRGQAFKNNSKLTNVKLPNKLEYLGGGAFYNCDSLTEIELPNTLTYLGGEAFKDSESLKSIKLSNNLTEIRGNTFENCDSLYVVEFPDSITRIGAHAFRDNDSLTEIKFNRTSKLTEIGSSAFRNCPKLYWVTLPKGTNVNERAFKESPTWVKYYTDVEGEYEY